MYPINWQFYLEGTHNEELENIVTDLKKARLYLTEEGDLQDFLGINIDMRKYGSTYLSQIHLIDQFLKDLNLDVPNMKIKDTPAESLKLLHRHTVTKYFDEHFGYRSVIEKLL